MNQTTPAGWYPDPQNPGQQRYWDGAKWTEHRAPMSSGSAPHAGAAPYPPQGGPTRAAPFSPPGGQSSQQNWFLRHKVLSAILAVFLFFMIVGAIGSAADSGGDDDTPAAADKSDEPTPSETPEPTPSETPEPTPSETPEPTPSETPEPEPKPKVIKVTAAQILKEFEENEAAADLKYGDHKLLEVTGWVSKVDTELFHDDRYVIQVAGPNYEYAFFTVNCDGQSAKDVAKIKVGQKITVGGDFQDGGDLGIELGGCHIV